MQFKFLALLAFMFVFGMAVTFGFITATHHTGFEKSAESTVQICVANEDISGGSKLTPNQFTLVEWPLSRMPEGAILNVEQFDEKYLKQNLYAGEPLIECKISSARGGIWGCMPLLTPEEIDRLTAEIVANREQSSDSTQ